MKTVSTLMLASATLVLLNAGCRDTPPPPPTTTGASTPAAQPAEPAPAATMDPTDPTAPAGGTPTSAFLSDAQILQVTHTANSGEIAQANLAQEKTKDARVKKLAQMMISDHSDADKRGGDLAQKENLMLTDSPVSMNVKSDGDQIMDDLRGKTGKDFDKAYVAAQVKEHQAVLDAIDGKLLPNAKDDEVKSFLRAVRPKIEQHLKHAQKLDADLAK
jgi:putative membrane protein